MSSQKILFFLLLSTVALYIAQKAGSYYFLIDPNNGFFAVSHLLGGVCIGLFLSWALVSFGRHPSMVLALLAALAIGLIWEYFEVAAGMTAPSAPKYWPDTLSDIVMDTLGGFFGALMASKGSLSQKH